MPIVECRLWDGAAIDWSRVRLAEPDYVRCQGACGGVFPGRHKEEVNSATGVCRECEARGGHDAQTQPTSSHVRLPDHRD